MSDSVQGKNGQSGRHSSNGQSGRQPSCAWRRPAQSSSPPHRCSSPSILYVRSIQGPADRKCSVEAETPTTGQASGRKHADRRLKCPTYCMSPTDDTRLAANTRQPTACRAGLLEACTTKDETLTKLTTSMRAAALTKRPRLDQGSPSAPCFTVTATVPVVAKGTVSFFLSTSGVRFARMPPPGSPAILVLTFQSARSW